MRPAVAVLALLLAASACLAKEAEKPPSPLAKKLDAIILPHAEFNEANINDVVPVLINASRGHDPDKTGVNIICLDRDNQAGISMDRKNISLHEVLKIISQQMGLVLDVEGKDVLLKKPDEKK